MGSGVPVADDTWALSSCASPQSRGQRISALCPPSYAVPWHRHRSSGCCTMGHAGTRFGWKLSLQQKIILAQKRTLPFRVSKYNHSHAHSPGDTFLFCVYSKHSFKYPELLIWTLFQAGFIALHQVLAWTHSLHKNWPPFHILKLFSWCILKSCPKLIWMKFPECTCVDKQ